MPGRPSTASLFRATSHTALLRHAVKSTVGDISLSEYLHEILAASGLSMVTFGQRIFISKVFAYQIFEGHRKPGRDILLSPNGCTPAK